MSPRPESEDRTDRCSPISRRGSTPSPLVNTNFSDVALISEQQNDLSVMGTIAQSSGPPIPQFDPVVSDLIEWNTYEHRRVQHRQHGVELAGGDGVNADFGRLRTWVSIRAPDRRQLRRAARYASDAPRYSYSPFFASSLGFTITQPLLQGFGAAVNRRYIRIARNSQRVADAIFRQQVMDTVAGIARLYTKPVSLDEDVKVKEEALRLADACMRTTATRWSRARRRPSK